MVVQLIPSCGIPEKFFNVFPLLQIIASRFVADIARLICLKLFTSGIVSVHDPFPKLFKNLVTFPIERFFEYIIVES